MKMSREEKERRKQRIRERIQIKMEQDNYEFFPGEDSPSIKDIHERQMRVAVYARVSTDNEEQTTSIELQKKYYEEFVNNHPNWTLVAIYADDGVSGTSDKKRDNFLQMIADCKAGKIDLIICKSISRLSRNNEILLRTVRELSELPNPVGIYFETEAIYTLQDDSEMALSFQGTMAQEESHSKSRSMEISLRMRLDHGLPLIAKLLGYNIDDNGKLQVDPKTAHIPKLMFYMYLYGYSTQEIADVLTELGKTTYRGNAVWSAGTVIGVLRNERYCGDVYTRKTYTVSWKTHKKAKNRGKRPISHYYDVHEPIISRDDYMAVQHMLDNAKYGNKSILPELRVVQDGLLKGFVVINPRWGGFKEQEYYQASNSVYPETSDSVADAPEVTVNVAEGDFDLRGFEICGSALFDITRRPYVSFADKKIKFGVECIRKISKDDKDVYAELLVHPVKRQFAVRSTKSTNKNGVVWVRHCDGQKYARDISAAAYFNTLFSLFGWKTDYKYRMIGSLYENGDERAYIFGADDADVFIDSEYVMLSSRTDSDSQITPIGKHGNRIRALPEHLIHSFGKEFYLGSAISAIDNQTKETWQIRMEGQLFDDGNQLHVTDYEDLRSYIKDQLTQNIPQEVTANES